MAQEETEQRLQDKTQSKEIENPRKRIFEKPREWFNDCQQSLDDFDKLKKMLMTRMDKADSLLKIVEDTIKSHSDLGDPLTLNPDSIGYDKTMELWLKILRAQKEIAEQYRKLEETNIKISDRHTKNIMKQEFLKLLEGLSLDEIRQLATTGNFAPTNMISASLLADGINDSATGSKALGSLSGWLQPVDADTNVIPSLTINLIAPDGSKKQITNNIINEDVSDAIEVKPKEKE